MDRRKRKIITSFNKLSDELITKLHETYPNGFSNQVIRVDKGNGSFFNAILLETEDAIYLVKVDAKVDISQQNPEAIIEDFSSLRKSLVSEIKKVFKHREFSDRIIGLF